MIKRETLAIYLYYFPKEESKENELELSDAYKLPILVKLIFEDDQRHHRVKIAEIMQTYLKSNDKLY